MANQQIVSPVSNNPGEAEFYEKAERMAAKRECSTCVYYQEELCKRRSPEVIYEQFGPLLPKRRTVWPETKPTDWCGEYQTI